MGLQIRVYDRTSVPFLSVLITCQDKKGKLNPGAFTTNVIISAQDPDPDPAAALIGLSNVLPKKEISLQLDGSYENMEIDHMNSVQSSLQSYSFWLTL